MLLLILITRTYRWSFGSWVISDELKDTFITRWWKAGSVCPEAKYVRGLGGLGSETLTSSWPHRKRIWTLGEESVRKVRDLSLFSHFKHTWSRPVWRPGLWRRSRLKEMWKKHQAHFTQVSIIIISASCLLCIWKWCHYCPFKNKASFRGAACWAFCLWLTEVLVCGNIYRSNCIFFL